MRRDALKIRSEKDAPLMPLAREHRHVVFPEVKPREVLMRMNKAIAFPRIDPRDAKHSCPKNMRRLFTANRPVLPLNGPLSLDITMVAYRTQMDFKWLTVDDVGFEVPNMVPWLCELMRYYEYISDLSQVVSVSQSWFTGPRPLTLIHLKELRNSDPEGVLVRRVQDTLRES